MKDETKLLNENHLESVFHENDHLLGNIANNKRFIIIEEIGNQFFHVIGYKKDNKVYVHKCSIDDHEKDYLDYFCETYKIDIESDSYKGLYDEKFNCNIIVTNIEIISEHFHVICRKNPFK